MHWHCPFFGYPCHTSRLLVRKNNIFLANLSWQKKGDKPIDIVWKNILINIDGFFSREVTIFQIYIYKFHINNNLFPYFIFSFAVFSVPLVMSLIVAIMFFSTKNCFYHFANFIDASSTAFFTFFCSIGKTLLQTFLELLIFSFLNFWWWKS